ncbi:N-acetyltransferase family protein [Phenylobacterium sp.]|jgi:GNAT superfamily N-acetyltransferase|uniref:GNAT family N-acetyltransferase n=1 Tax=Phenylobacterium sp. TaxID=1871053 RepID=UPI0035B32B5E
MALAIRLAGPQDAGLALAIDPVAATSPHRAQWLRAAFAGDHGRIARLALLDGQPAGFAVVGAFFSNPFLDLLVTGEAFRRRGVASALLDAVEAAHADRKLFVSTNASNTLMRALLPARGYLPAGRVDHLDPGDPELFFVRLPV